MEKLPVRRQNIVRTLELFSLEGKTAVVTGAAGLLGRHHCRALADAGATVVATDVDQPACQEVARDLSTASFGYAADVTDRASIKRLLSVVLERTGGVDVLVNNAAINDMFESPSAVPELSKFENYPLEMWRKSLDVNVTGMFICSQVIGSKMAEGGCGSIINIASTYGIVAPDQSLYIDHEGKQGLYKSAIYPTTKGAVLSFTRFLASYWGKAGVRVNTLAPGGVQNGQDDFFVTEYSRRTPLGRMALPGDYMGALLFLASDASSYMTGANLVVDGGFTVW
jgi:NAD(P)-dependent dehydrogenase (short-subunit alcohol dehydrogenase family)